jgi:hypothetical protein
MPIETPQIDSRTYEDLRRELLARIPAHNPEWTQRDPSDPGITLLELFAFLSESLIYRMNRIPERNRSAFLRLLGIPLHPGTPARGLVALTAKVSTTVAVPTGAQVSAGKLPFRIDRGLVVAPVEAMVLRKARAPASAQAEVASLYAAKLAGSAPTPYITTAMDPNTGLVLGATPDALGAIDGTVWVALLAPQRRDPAAIHAAIAGQVLSLGLAPAPTRDGRVLAPKGVQPETVAPTLEIAVPTSTGWRTVARDGSGLTAPTTLEIPLPGAADLPRWTDPDPAFPGVGDVPPPLPDDATTARLITWLRLRLDRGALTLRWVGVNAASITQGDAVRGEAVGTGTGETDQRYPLARRPVVAGTIRVSVDGTPWIATDDLDAAPREGATGSQVFGFDPEAGELRFGDGMRGARPKRGAKISASYDANAGSAGNLAPGTLKRIDVPNLDVTQPVETWGGTAAETVDDGSRQIARSLQHRDRLVTADDFSALAARTPGVSIARVDVLPAYHPAFGSVSPGDAPGAVTLVVVPAAAPPGQPPTPDDATLDAVCAWLEPRRLVTTEIVLRGPTWKYLDISVGLDVRSVGPAGSLAEVTTNVRQAIIDFLSPLPHADGAPGWALGRAVRKAELLVAAARVPGVVAIDGVRLAVSGGAEADEIPLGATELPWIAAIGVTTGNPMALDALRPSTPSAGPNPGVPVPTLPDTCA